MLVISGTFKDRAIQRDGFGWPFADSCGKFQEVCYEVVALHFCPDESFMNTITRRIYGLWASGIV